MRSRASAAAGSSTQATRPTWCERRRVKVEQFRGCHRSRLAEGDERHRFLAEDDVLLPDHRGLEHLGMAIEDVLDLFEKTRSHWPAVTVLFHRRSVALRVANVRQAKGARFVRVPP